MPVCLCQLCICYCPFLFCLCYCCCCYCLCQCCRLLLCLPSTSVMAVSFASCSAVINVPAMLCPSSYSASASELGVANSFFPSTSAFAFPSASASVFHPVSASAVPVSALPASAPSLPLPLLFFVSPLGSRVSSGAALAQLSSDQLSFISPAGREGSQ